MKRENLKQSFARILKLNKHLKIILMIIVVIVLLCFIAGTVLQHGEGTPAYGILNISNRELNDPACILMDGQWEFYWHKFVQYEDLDKVKPDLLVTVPSTWDQYIVDGKDLPLHGYGTYRVHVKTSLPAGTRMGFYIISFSSAYNLYVNDELVASNGHVADTSEKEIGEYRPLAAYFEVPSSEFDILINVSNFHYSRGGFWYNISIGKADNIFEYAALMSAESGILDGALILVSVYYLLIYLTKRDLQYELYFALTAICTLFFTDAFGQNYLLRMVPGMSIDTSNFIWNSSGALLSFFFTAYWYEYVKTSLSLVILKISCVMNLLLLILFLFSAPSVYAHFIVQNEFSYISFPFVVFTMNILLILYIVWDGTKKNVRDSRFSLIGVMIFGLGYFLEFLGYSILPRYLPGTIFGFGILICIFQQMYFHLKRQSDYSEVQLDNEFKFLQARVKPQFLYDAIDVFKETSFHDIDKTTDLMIDFSDFLRKSFRNNLTGDVVPLSDEIDTIEAYLRIVQEMIPVPITVNYELPENQDFFIPQFILQPIIEHTIEQYDLKRQARIELGIKVEKRQISVRFSIKANYEGMGKTIRPIIEADLSKWIQLGLIHDITVWDHSEYGTEVTWNFFAKDAMKRQDEREENAVYEEEKR